MTAHTSRFDLLGLPQSEMSNNTIDRVQISSSSLPNETLLAIFQLVHQSTQTPSSQITKGQPEQSSEAHDPMLFPYSLAYVCRRWLDVLAMDERFWTWIIVHIDGPLATTHAIKTIAEASRDNRIRVSICYRAIPLMNPDHENERVNLAMKSLQPHLSRCYDFNLNGLYRSSTVIASRYLNGISAPDMIKMALTSSIVDTDQSIAMETLDCPRLLWVYLDAKSLADFAHVNAGWRAPHSRSNVALHSTRYRPLASLYPLSSAYFARAMIEAKSRGRVTFNLSDVMFAHCGSTPTDISDPSIQKGEIFISFTHMDGQSISRLLNCLMLTVVETGAYIGIDRCTLEDFELCRHLSGQTRLGLVNIEDPAGVRAILSQWDGQRLLISDCAGFDDTSIHMVEKNLEFCPNLASLAIEGACSWTPRAMMQMCKARRESDRMLEMLKAPADAGRPSQEELKLIEASVENLYWGGD